MQSIQLAFLLFIVCTIVLSSTLTTFLIHSVELVFSILLQHRISKLSQVLLIYFPKRPGVNTVQMYTPIAALCLCNGNQLDVRNIYP
jgi:hypothetical protein